MRVAARHPRFLVPLPGRGQFEWPTAQRVLHARELLEETDLSIEEVAHQCGFSTAALLRHHFQRTVGLSPNATAAPSPASPLIALDRPHWLAWLPGPDQQVFVVVADPDEHRLQ